MGLFIWCGAACFQKNRRNPIRECISYGGVCVGSMLLFLWECVYGLKIFGCVGICLCVRISVCQLMSQFVCRIVNWWKNNEISYEI